MINQLLLVDLIFIFKVVFINNNDWQGCQRKVK